MPEVGEVRTSGDETRRWNGQGWELIAVQEAPPEVPVMSVGPLSGVTPSTLRSIASGAAEVLPYVGGLGGGVMGAAAGPPGVAGGAALGAAGGEAWKQNIQRAIGDMAPETAGEAAQAIASQAAIQGTLAGTGALAAGAGIVGRLARFAATPAGGATIGAVDAARRGRGPEGIATEAAIGYAGGRGAKAVLGKVAEHLLKPAEKARVAHAVKRSIKEAVAEAPKAAPVAAKATPAVAKAAPAAPGVPVEDILADMQKRVTSMHDLGIDAKDISKSLVRHYEQQGRGAGLTAGKMRPLVDEIIKQAGEKATQARAAKTITDEMAEFVISRAGGGTSRAQMASALRENFPGYLNDSGARKVVDVVLDTKKIGPKPTTAEVFRAQGLGMNDQIRAARAAVAAKGGS